MKQQLTDTQSQYFNSTIVRLKAVSGFPNICEDDKFQFNYCTIKRLL